MGAGRHSGFLTVASVQAAIVAFVVMLVSSSGVVARSGGGSAGGDARAVGERELAIDSERLRSGVPLGGLGQGKIELLTDGSLGNVTFQNNWSSPIGELRGSFFAVSAAREGSSRRVSRSLRHGDALGLPAVARTLFHGVFPRAFVDFPDPDLPLKLSLEAFSPLVPHDEKHSSLPVAFFTFRLENEGAAAVDASVLFSFENTIGLGCDAAGPFADRTGNVGEWREEGYLRGLHFANVAAKGGRAFPEDRLSSLGDVTILAPAGDGIGITGRPSWNVLTEAAALFEDFSTDGELSPVALGAESSPGLEGSWHPAGAIAARRTIEPGGAATLTFVLAWNFPRLVLPGGDDFGHAHSRQFDDSWKTALYARDRIEWLRERTHSWQDLLLASNLPSWLAEKLANDLAPLVTHSLYSRDGRFALLESHGDGRGRFASLEDRFLAQPALLAFFPRLDAAGLRQAAKSQSRSGELPRSWGSLAGGFGTPPVDGRTSGRPEQSAAFVLSAYHHVLATGDSALERELYPHVRDAVRFLVSLDRDGDALPDAPAASASTGTTASAGGAMIAALRAAGELARRDGDVNFAADCDRRLGEAVRAFSSGFWNGRFFESSSDPRSGQRSSDCAIPQLFGSFALQAVGLPPVLNETSVRTAVRTILELNGRAGGRLPADAVGATGGPSERDRERGESPASTLRLVTAVLPSLAFRFGYPEEGFECLRSVDAAVRGVNRSPWASPAAFGAFDGRAASDGAHVSSLSSWQAFRALAGFFSEFGTGRLRTAPWLCARWNSLHVPLFSPRYVADFRIERIDSGPDRLASLEILSVEGAPTLSLREWEIGIPETAAPERTSVLVESPRGVERGTVRLAPGTVRFTFETAVPLAPGQGLRAHVGFGDAHQVILTAGSPSSAMSLGADAAIAGSAPDSQTLKLEIENRASGWQFVWLRVRSSGGAAAFPGKRELFVDGKSQGLVESADLESGRGFWLRHRVVDRGAESYLRAVEARLRERLPALKASADAPKTAAGEVESFQRNAAEFLAREKASRTSEVLIAPPGTTVPRTGAPDLAALEARSRIEGLEQAIVDLRASLARSSAPPHVRAAWIAALTPVDAVVTPAGEMLPGEAVPVRVFLANPFRLEASGRIDVRFEDGLDARSLSGEGTLDRSFLATVAGSLPRRRYRVETEAEVAVEGATFRLSRRHAVGHAPLRDFLVIGPFDDPDGSAFAAPFPPERAIDLEASVPVRGGSARWERFAGAGDSIDLDAHFAPDHESAVAYALTFVECPTEREAILELGFDEGLQAFLNGESVFRSRTAEREALFSQERVRVTLRAGTNRLLIKSAQSSGPWRFTAELTDKDGFTFPDVTASSAPARDVR